MTILVLLWILIQPYRQGCIDTLGTDMLHRSTTGSRKSSESSSHESSIFQIKLERNTGCFKEDKERK